jgi:hypothetical protein
MFSLVNDTSKGTEKMITLQPLIPSAPNLSALDQLITMMAFLGDSEACKARLGELRQAAEESAAIVAHADELRAEIAKEREALEAERAVQEKQIEADRVSLQARRSAWENELNVRDAESKKLNEAAKAALAIAERHRDDLKIKIERVKSAAA